MDKLAGKQIPGGCEYCDAYQTVQRFPGVPVDDGAGAFVATTHHDDDCPFYVRTLNRAARRAAVKRARSGRPAP